MDRQKDGWKRLSHKLAFAVSMRVKNIYPKFLLNDWYPNFKKLVRGQSKTHRQATTDTG